MKLHTRLRVCAILAAALFSTACAKTDVGAMPPRAATCAGCHGGNGMVTQPAVPRLAGQSAIYLSRQLHAYRDGSRKDPVMGALAGALTDEDVESIAAWYESLPPDLAH